jgi:hypothetical protein
VHVLLAPLPGAHWLLVDLPINEQPHTCHGGLVAGFAGRLLAALASGADSAWLARSVPPARCRHGPTRLGRCGWRALGRCNRCGREPNDANQFAGRANPAERTDVATGDDKGAQSSAQSDTEVECRLVQRKGD